MQMFIAHGRLTRDPEIRYASEMAVANYSIAVDRRYKKDGEPTADFFNITAFGKQAELLEKYFKKGSEIAITCRVQNNNWTDKEGKKHHDIQFLQEQMDFCGSSSEKTEKTNDGFVDAPEGLEDELPFV